MRKKIALLLAIATVVTMFPATVFAATTNTVSSRLTDVPGGTTLYEQGILPRSGIFNVIDISDGDRPERILGDGSDLILRVGNTSDYVRAGGIFRVTLENAVWAFAGSNQISIPSGAAFAPGYPVTINNVNVDSNLDNNSPLFYRNGVLDQNGLRTAPNGYAANYDLNYGIFTNEWVPGGLPVAQVKRTYFRYGEMLSRGGTTGGSAGTTIEIPYRLDITSATEGYVTIYDSVAYADALGNYKNGWMNATAVAGLTYELRIPMVVKTDSGEKDARVTVGGNVTNVTPQTLVFVAASAAGVVATGGDVVVARSTFNINAITLNERNLSALKTTGDPTTGGGSVILTLPTGFHWYNPQEYNVKNGADYVVKVDLKPMLAWNNSGFNPNSTGASEVYNRNVQGAGIDPGFTVAESIRYDKTVGLWTATTPPVMIDAGKLISFSTVVPKYTRNGEADDRMLRISLFNITRTSQLTGSVVISGLSFYCDDTVAFGTTAKIYVNQDEYGTELDGDAHAQLKHTAGVIATNFAVATREDWVVKLSTDATPTLISGRWIWDSANSRDADNATHATGKITFEEITPAAWWALRETVFQLPVSGGLDSPGVKIRKLQIFNADNGSANIDNGGKLWGTAAQSKTFGITYDTGVYGNDGETHELVKVKDSQFILSNVAITPGKKGKIAFKLWLSVEFGFGAKFGGDSGLADVTLTVPSMATYDPSGVPKQQPTDAPSLVVAKVKDPITVEIRDNKVTELMIGLQSQASADIIIRETAPGMLMRGKDVRVSVSDLISSDMVFTNNAVVKVTNDSNMLLGNISKTGGVNGWAGWETGAYNGNLNAGGTYTDTGLRFEISRQSTNMAAEITISNVGLKLDRSVPLTNAQFYKAIVWGSAVAENFGYMHLDSAGKPYTSKFTTPGAVVDYAKVVSDTNDISMLNRKVTVTENDRFYTVNNITYDMGNEGEEVYAYISTASNSMMVPVRFIANALGISDDSIYWDNVNKTVTIIAANRTVSFTANSSTMRINGADITMQSLDVPPLDVKAELTRDRMYVPFRQLANAFGITVGWDDATRTATYNPAAIDAALQ